MTIAAAIGRAAEPPPNNGAKRADKLSAKDAPDKMLTKVIPT